MPSDDEAEELLVRAGTGDTAARDQLMQLHYQRLCGMVALRMDHRLRARIDPADVVQEALLEAFKQIPQYLSERPLPFYPWLRQLTWKRLIDLHRHHVLAQRRSVHREEAKGPPLPASSLLELVDRLLDSGTSPSATVAREEQRTRVHAALDNLSDKDREVLVLRFLERLSLEESAAVLGITVGAVKVRQFRALERLRDHFTPDASDATPG